MGLLYYSAHGINLLHKGEAELRITCDTKKKREISKDYEAETK